MCFCCAVERYAEGVFHAQKLCSTPFRCKLRSERLAGDTRTRCQSFGRCCEARCARKCAAPPIGPKTWHTRAKLCWRTRLKKPSQRLLETAGGPLQSARDAKFGGSLILSAASAARPCATAAGSWLVPTRVSCTFSWQQSAEQPPARRTPHAWRYLVPQLAMLCARRTNSARSSRAATGASPSYDRKAHRHRRTAHSQRYDTRSSRPCARSATVMKGGRPP